MHVIEHGAPTSQQAARQRHRRSEVFRPANALLERLQDVGTARDRAGNRTLCFNPYCAYILLFLFNPIVTLLRGIQQASGRSPLGQMPSCVVSDTGGFPLFTTTTMSRTRWSRDLSKERLCRQRLARWERSCLTGRDFCRRKYLSEPSFYGWKREIARRDRESAAPAVRGRQQRRPRATAVDCTAFVPLTVVQRA